MASTIHLPPITPAQQWPAELLLRAQGIKIVFFDVDGVLTDGGLYISEQGETLKRFHTLDGHGLKLLQNFRIESGDVTLACIIVIVVSLVLSVVSSALATRRFLDV